jgi:hypothetical protein
VLTESSTETKNAVKNDGVISWLRFGIVVENGAVDKRAWIALQSTSFQVPCPNQKLLTQKVNCEDAKSCDKTLN